jgi:hypothetical protein
MCICGPLAQWQSTSLITTWFQVRILGGPPNEETRIKHREPLLLWFSVLDSRFA